MSATSRCGDLLHRVPGSGVSDSAYRPASGRMFPRSPQPIQLGHLLPRPRCACRSTTSSGFHTSDAGDFESLVRRLTPQVLTADVGLSLMDVTHPDLDIAGAGPPPLGLQGALQSLRDKADGMERSGKRHFRRTCRRSSITPPSQFRSHDAGSGHRAADLWALARRRAERGSHRRRLGERSEPRSPRSQRGRAWARRLCRPSARR